MVFTFSVLLNSRSNQSEQLPLNELCITTAIEIHRTLFLRSHEILRHIIIERTSFETFSTWLLIMSEYILSHDDDSHDRPPPVLHNLDTVKIAQYISENFQSPILAKFLVDLESDTAMQVEGCISYFTLIHQLIDAMKTYFRAASEELKEGVSWVIPNWIDLEIHEEIASSDMYVKHQVHTTLNEILMKGWEKVNFYCRCSTKISRE